jgi:DNA-binding response OmpR family regulator
MERILVIEDDDAIVMVLKDDLEFEGYAVSAARDGREGLKKALARSYCLIILDILLPKLNGFEVCRQLRAAKVTTPVLMLTAAKTAEMDKVRGLELGADDYVTKPFGAKELMARIKAILRRASDSRDEAETFQFDDFTVDFRNHEVLKAGEKIHLTALEFKLLRHLIRHRDQVVSREDLLDSVWDDVSVARRTIEPHIVYLRKKLERNPALPTRILSVRGVGYRFRG